MPPRRILPLLLLLLAAGCGSRTTRTGSGTGSDGSGSSGGSDPASTFAYVSSAPESSTYQINGYSVAASGALTPIAGSPFSTTGYGPLSMASTGSMLFGADGYSIDSFSIGSNGALKQTSSFAAGKLSQSSPSEPVGGPINLFFDASSSTLYDGFANLDGTENNGYQALSVSSGGAVKLIGNQGASPALGGMLAFAGNDEYAYTSSCYHGIPEISAFARGSNGALTQMAGGNFSAMPAAPSGDGYCPLGATADSSNHLIVSVGETSGDAMESSGPWQLATYSIDGSGNVSTVSTSSTMPTTDVGQPVSYLFSPDDKYLAVGGLAGLQVFAYDSTSGAISSLGTSAVLTGDNISQVAWDSGDHLYALAQQASNLYVYSVSSSGATAVSGSPYAAPGAYALTVVTVKSGT
jgi:WD40 repeat protein